MKQFFLILAASITLFSCGENGKGTGTNADSLKQAEAAQQKQTALKDSANFTTIAWTDKDTVNKNMGIVKKGQTIEITYNFKNTGNKPLVIASVEPGCGCTVADKPEQPIAPGGEGKIVGKFNSTNQTDGSHSKNIIVRANTKPRTDHILLFTVNVQP